jgi:phage terminase small subunit
MRKPSDRDAIRFVIRATQRAWERVAPGLRRRGILNPRNALGLAFCCMQVAQYQLLLTARRQWPKDRDISVALEAARLRTRESAADFSLIPMARIRLGPLTPSGEDVELLKIFGRPAA